MNSKFKNIIFFSIKSDKSVKFRTQLEKIKFIKIFSTNDIEEVQQIIDMSDRAVLLVDDEISANKLFKATLNKKRAQFKKYYLNWSLIFARGAKEQLIEQEFTCIDTEEIDTAIARVELYLFGKINVFNHPDYVLQIEEEKIGFKKGYFTHLKKVDREWKIQTSSHEADDEINKKLGKNWDLFLEGILKEASDLSTFYEKKLDTAPYYELVYPHMKNGKITKLSVVHVNVDDNFSSIILGVHKFLEALN